MTTSDRLLIFRQNMLGEEDAGLIVDDECRGFVKINYQKWAPHVKHSSVVESTGTHIFTLVVGEERTIDRTLEQFQQLHSYLLYRFPKSRLPFEVPKRTWGNLLGEIQETIANYTPESLKDYVVGEHTILSGYKDLLGVSDSSPSDHVLGHPGDKSSLEDHIAYMEASLSSYLASLMSVKEAWNCLVCRRFFEEEHFRMSNSYLNHTVSTETFLLQALPRSIVELANKGKFELDVRILGEHDVVIWDFCVLEHDIAFTVHFDGYTNNTGSPKVIKRKPKVPFVSSSENVEDVLADKCARNSSQWYQVVPYTHYVTSECCPPASVQGRFWPGKAGVLRLEWDNSFSVLRSKTLRYVVEVVSTEAVEAASSAAKDAAKQGLGTFEEGPKHDQGSHAWPENDYDKTARGECEAMEGALAPMQNHHMQQIEPDIILADTQRKMEEVSRSLVNKSKQHEALLTAFQELQKELGDANEKSRKLEIEKSEMSRLIEVLTNDRTKLEDEKRAMVFSEAAVQKLEVTPDHCLDLEERLCDSEGRNKVLSEEIVALTETSHKDQVELAQLRSELKMLNVEISSQKALELSKQLSAKASVQKLADEIQNLKTSVAKYKAQKIVLIREVKMLRVQVQELQEEHSLNNGASADILREKIDVIKFVIMDAGQTPANIAFQNGMRLKDFKLLNQIKGESVFERGFSVYVVPNSRNLELEFDNTIAPPLAYSKKMINREQLGANELDLKGSLGT